MIFKANLDDMTSIGTASTAMKAKHAAAGAMIDKLGLHVEPNMVEALQWLTVEKGYELPIYDYVSMNDQGSNEIKKFVVNCSVRTNKKEDCRISSTQVLIIVFYVTTL